jgi:hypothetical protein
MGTATNVLLAVLYNLISEVVGGLSFVVEERPARRGRRQPAPVVEPAPAPLTLPEAELKQPRRSPERTPTAVRPRPSSP